MTSGRTNGGIVVSLCVLIGVMLLCSAPALAQSGHVFSSSFGAAGTGAGQFSSPAGVAVNESTGNVYVVDRGNNRVAVFTAAGGFIEAWGWGVKDGKKEYEQCTSVCQAGIAGVGKGQFKSPESIAVDNSSDKTDPSAGDVYVGANATDKTPNVEKFTATGEALGRLPAKEEGDVDGVAVDAAGSVWLYRRLVNEGQVQNFSNGTPNKALKTFAVEGPEFPLCAKPGIAVDAKATTFYVDHEHLNSEGACPEEPEPARPVNAAKFVRSTNKEGEVVTELVTESIDNENTSAIAVDSSSSNVYVDNEHTVAAYSASGAFIERFGSGELTKGSGLAINAKTREVYVADAGANKVDIFTEPAGAPRIEGLSEHNLTPTSAALEAQIAPNGTTTHYYFQYGTVDCSVSPSSCTDVPAPPGEALKGSGFAPETVSQEISNLQPNTVYYYRVLAENANGKVESQVNSFITLPQAAGVLADNRAWELVSPPNKHGAALEPIGTDGGFGADIQASEDGNALTYVSRGPVVAEPEGNQDLQMSQVLSARGEHVWSSQEITTPNHQAEGGTVSEAPVYQTFSTDLRFALVLPLAPSTVFEEPPLSTENTTRERTIYRRNNAACAEAPTTCFQPLVTASNDTAKGEKGEPVKFGGQTLLVTSTPDLNHAVIESAVPLTANGAAGLYEWSSGKPPAEQLQFVSALPGGTAAASPEAGDKDLALRNAISNDGRRIFWTEEENGGEHLFMYDATTAKTVQVNAPEKPFSPPLAAEAEQVHFQVATPDGSRVFFTDTAALTKESNLEPVAGKENAADLYEYDAATSKVTDLTPRASNGSADVLNTLPGFGEGPEGLRVYFVANGALAPGAKPGTCKAIPTPTATCSLYVYEPDPAHSGQYTTKFVATLSSEDAPDWGGPGSQAAEGGRLGLVTSRVSPNGRYLAFMTNRTEEATGYNNHDANSGIADEEVMLYDAASGGGRLVCASCNPSGARPEGVFDPEEAGESTGLLVDSPKNWVQSGVDHWLAGSIPGWTLLGYGSNIAGRALYQSRYLSDTGRLFFNSADGLVSHDENRKEDVYEYEPAGIGSCQSSAGCVGLISSGTSEHESAFLDASVGGNSVFFLTSQPLVGADIDQSFDVYDARVCSPESPCLTSEAANPRPCESNPSADNCRAGTSSSPSFSAPASSTASGPGVVAKQEALPSKEKAKPKPLTRAQKLSNALRSCRKKWKHAKKKRVACERQARKTYAAKKATKHSKKSKGKK